MQGVLKTCRRRVGARSFVSRPHVLRRVVPSTGRGNIFLTQSHEKEYSFQLFVEHCLLQCEKKCLETAIMPHQQWRHLGNKQNNRMLNKTKRYEYSSHEIEATLYIQV